MPFLGSAEVYTVQEDIAVFRKADSLFAAQDFTRAALEYERVIFGATDPDIINAALFGRVQSFKQMQEFARASGELRRIRLFMLNPEQLVDYFYEKILLYYLAGSFSEARGAIGAMYFSIPDSALSKNTLMLQVLVYNELQEWDLARQTALRYAHNLPSPQRETMESLIEQLYSERNLPNLRSQRVANVLAFVPGLGHIYAGHWLEGMVSFLLNSAALAFGVHQVLSGYFITGYLVGAGTLSATYFGGFGRASFLVDKHNYRVTRSFNNHVRKRLLEPQRGSDFEQI